ncbi:cysteine--tRNA ligase [Aliikangiella coralliicola]|uniref:Cysteine--tRNA ligase n=1 Tax=Aliikangiella coralliicola TaxID=2592383 RepID=A0A545UCI1_9GAMM|nr:cysteine--tRNA ligase [Aliikangiella coralliicola]TQV87170.1 cysteine--tRNA ligase [Aliikangiella coralliicola]
MMELNLFDTYRREVVSFDPVNLSEVGLYSCGPTVYDYAHIGNLRTYLFVDTLKRVLSFNGYSVKHVMNITDVGHLVSDGDTGEDKMEKGARLQNLSAWEIAKKYEAHFFEDMHQLNIQIPTIVCRATEHISEQIEFIKVIEEKGFSYKTNDGIYFDTSKLEDYGHLARLDVKGLKAGARIDIADKLNITDFALWKFSGKTARQMEWESPWGKGFPGWHIECSAMAEKYLGELFDIHVGGEDHIPVHHSNEIAQSQAKNKTRMANIWMHGYFLQIDNEKVAKSGKSITLSELVKKGYDPLSYRYLTLSAHYRSRLNFTWESLQGAENALKRLRKLFVSFGETGTADEHYMSRFESLVNQDLNIPQALALMWEMLNSQLSPAAKKATLLHFDQVFGLQLASFSQMAERIPVEIERIAEARFQARQNKDWHLSDQLREQLTKLGYSIEDHSDSYKIKKI